MKTPHPYTAEIYDAAGIFMTVHVTATKDAIIGTLYEKYPNCQIVRYY